MREFRDHRWLALNTATVRQADLLAIIDACARHGIRAIDPWRDQVAAVGLDRAVKAVRDSGLELSGYCRGGMFPADAANRAAARDDNRRAVDEAKALGAPCLVLVVGGLPQYSRPGSAPSKDLGAAQAMVEDEIGVLMEYARAGEDAARHRAAASDVCRRPRLREHAAPGARHLRPARSRTQRHARRHARRLSHLVGLRADAADRARRTRAAARIPRLRLAGADQGPAQRPRHDGRRRHRHSARARGGRSARLCRLCRCRAVLPRLVEPADGRGARGLHRAVHVGRFD